MRCDAASRILGVWRDGELDEAVARVLEEHVRECTRCGAQLRELEQVSASLRREFYAAVPDGLAERAFYAAIKAEPPVSSFLQSFFPIGCRAALATLAAAVLLVGWSLSIEPSSVSTGVDPVSPLLAASSGHQLEELFSGTLGIDASSGAGNVQ